jgi:hypothetical protein
MDPPLLLQSLPLLLLAVIEALRLEGLNTLRRGRFEFRFHFNTENL